MRSIHRLSGVYRTYGDTVTLALTDIEIPDGKIIAYVGSADAENRRWCVSSTG